jgi:hypothetical protein
MRVGTLPRLLPRPRQVLPVLALTMLVICVASCWQMDLCGFSQLPIRCSPRLGLLPSRTSTLASATDPSIA